MNFQLQERSFTHDIWYTPESYKGLPAGADSVSSLRSALQQYADTTSLSFTQHFRIVSRFGKPVERWKILPGLMKKTRSKY